MKKNSMLKLRKIIEKVYDCGKLPRNFTLVDFRMLEDVYDTIRSGETGETISLSVKTVLENCGFTCKACGIGWIITR